MLHGLEQTLGVLVLVLILLDILCSCPFLAAMLFGAAAGFYPTVLPSSVNPALDLTIQKAEAGPHAISAGLLWWGLVLLSQ